MAIDSISHYDYPGNVLDLYISIDQSFPLCEDDLITPADLPPNIVAEAQGEKSEKVAASMPVGQPLDDFVQQQERSYIEATLQHCAGSREKAASMLGISMATLYRKVEPKSKAMAK